jgi:uncharacterized protein YecE (DUF72 family)
VNPPPATPPSEPPSASIRVGSCAWSFEDWRGPFYPEHLPPNQWLGFYAEHLPAVEVDSTFYAAPTSEVAAHWAEITPSNFRFTCKLPREITHERKLRDCQLVFREFLEAIDPLRPKLACLLIQLPPFFVPRSDEVALKEFIFDLPRDLRFAIEFRHRDWHVPRVAHLLESERICWVWNDLTPFEHQEEGAFEFLPQTTDFAYVRLLGDFDTKYREDGSRRHRYRQLVWPRDASLDSWTVRIRQHVGDFSEVLVFVNNHFEGFAPETCLRLAKRLGIEMTRPKPPPPSEAQLDLL